MTSAPPVIEKVRLKETLHEQTRVALLDRWSDFLSPIVVKEVRQMVRGREFNYSFSLSLLAGLAAAAYGGVQASYGNVFAGPGILTALIVCLAVIGILVVPMGTFQTLRTEKAEQTLDLITLTALTPRRIIIGKLFAQAVKLITLFAGLSPFMTMSFLLGGIDFFTILIALVSVFMWSLWACAASLFMSCLLKSRTTGLFVFAALLVPIVLVIGAGPNIYMRMMFGRGLGGSSVTSSTDIWWALAGMMAICFISMVNLVLLAENRLTLPTEDRSTALRVGFLVQFLFIVAVTVSPRLMGMTGPGYSASDVIWRLGIVGGLHLALVAVFSVTEDMTLSRRILRYDTSPGRWHWATWFFRPGGGRGTIYVLAQMAVLLLIGFSVKPVPDLDMTRGLAICGYICFFTGVPACAGRYLLPARARAAGLRVAVLLLFPIVMLSADLLYFFTSPTRVFDGSYAVYHVLNPFRTLANWPRVTSHGWHTLAFEMGVIGLLSYFKLIHIGHRAIQAAKSEHAGAAN